MSTDKTRAHYEAMAVEATGTSDGGPAFPVSTSSKVSDDCGPYGHQDSGSTWQFPGMTLRDYFAAKAMLTVFCPGGPNNEWAKIEETFDCAQRCYAIADAMLKAREVQS